MPKYMIERQMAGAGQMAQQQLKEAARKSNEVLQQMGGGVLWLESFVTDDKIYCVYIAPNAEQVRHHAQMSGFPADRVSEIRMIMDPSTAEESQSRKAA